MGRKIIGAAGKAIGEKGSTRRRWASLLSFVIAIGASLAYIQTVLAVHDTGVFQVDGDATQALNTAGTPTATDDWDRVCYQVVFNATIGTAAQKKAAADA